MCSYFGPHAAKQNHRGAEIAGALAGNKHRHYQRQRKRRAFHRLPRRSSGPVHGPSILNHVHISNLDPNMNPNMNRRVDASVDLEAERPYMEAPMFRINTILFRPRRSSSRPAACEAAPHFLTRLPAVCCIAHAPMPHFCGYPSVRNSLHIPSLGPILWAYLAQWRRFEAARYTGLDCYKEPVSKEAPALVASKAHQSAFKALCGSFNGPWTANGPGMDLPMD
ncbi:hypothetical protein GGX14DRAFT_403387 [Mycena pura]|uniref:Uncharacterized protein n=1 Tax=Mycena pura TaxID=153505 RepID=A0AAD6UWW4_9AGAR|nr:hypothetical protein GGX14DRAFT_403387 [Mycena pura]